MNEKQLNQLISEMTLAEKVGQLVQLTPDFFVGEGEITGPLQDWKMSQEQLYQIGSVLGTHTADQVMKIQEEYLANSRLKIPLVFMADVIHGYESIYPIPLALAATFDKEVVKEVARLSAKEATEAGVHVTFSPMADHVLDARWGRVLESNGEDPTLSSELVRGYIQGYQGKDLSQSKERMAACVKHFVGYGAARGGRDYNTVDFSTVELYQNYLPAFQAAIDEGVELVMTSFNTMNGMPVTGNKQLIQEVLRGDLNFEGVIISDWAAVLELIAHRVAEDKAEAAKLAFEAGIDMDMMSDCYQSYLSEIVLEAAQLEKIDQAVLRILTLKNKLGLFEDPYRGLKEKTVVDRNNTKEELKKSIQRTAEKTAVLLKNEDDLLPLQKGAKVALIGPKSASQDVLGAWSWIGDSNVAVSLATGLAEKEIDLTVLPIEDGVVVPESYIQETLKVAKENDVIIIAVGETSEESGEAASLADITLSRNQEKLIQSVAQVNPNVVVVLFNGRPLALSNIIDGSKSILEVWFPGSQAGHAVANLLMGETNPSGKLPMSFPRSVGQVPISYAALSTGRPMHEGNQDQKYISRYMDEANDPLFSFGHGLSYSKFEVLDAGISKKTFSDDEEIKVSVLVRNVSEVHGKTTIQVYSHDLVTQLARPIKELKKWQSVELDGKEEKELYFVLSAEDFKYIHSDLTNQIEKGIIKLFIGQNSQEAEVIHEIMYKK